MPAASLQSRINAFESLSRPSPLHAIPISPPTSPLPTNLLEAPISPTASSFASISPFRASQSSSRSSSASPPVLGRKTSLIDLKDWDTDDGFSTSPSPKGFDLRWNGKSNGMNSLNNPNNVRNGKSSSAILINFEPPSSQPIPIKAPPLPPRKTPSYTSLKSVSSSNSTSTRSGGVAAPQQAPVRADTSTNLTVEHTYPPLSKLETLSYSRKVGHAPASSVSSFHSVSLSSDGGTTDGGVVGSVTNHTSTFPINHTGPDADSVSLDESFEDVAALSIASPTSAAALAFNWGQQQTPKPPKLPQWQPSRQPNVSPIPSPSPLPPPRPSSAASSSSGRRAPPLPPRIPSRTASARTSLISTTASDRSSILSVGTATTSRTSMSSAPASATVPKALLVRPTPIPAAARRRYEDVFAANVLQQRRQAGVHTPVLLSPPRKSRQAAGWRGLSVDLITNPEEHPLHSDSKTNGYGLGTTDEGSDTAGLQGKLDGHIVKLIWSTSRLHREKLRGIWRECDVSRTGALNRDAFTKGMWLIDEELRKSQTKPSSISRTTSRARLPPKSTTSKPILR